MAPKNKSGKALLKEPDKFLSFSTRLLEFVLAYKTQLIVGFAALLLLAVGISFYRIHSERTENRAYTLLGQSMAKYQSIQSEGDAQKALAEVSADFDKLIDTYGGKQAGKLGRIVYADICYRAGDIDTAVTMYSRALEDFEDQALLTSMIRNGLGYAYLQKKAYGRATEYFQTNLDAPDAFWKGQSLYNLALIYEAQGQTAKSREALERVASDYPDSLYIDIVKSKIAG